MKPQQVTVLGGTGFLGRAVVQELVKAGYAVQVVARHALRAAKKAPLGYQTRVVYRNGDITDSRCLQELIPGSFAVINLVGILFESRRQRFSAIHAQCPERLAKIAHDAGVQRFVHVSALGVDTSAHSVYARSKGTGEKAVMAAFPQATIFRPSVIFGAEDNFINQFAKMATLSPALPLIGGGKTRFQPVYVGDVARAIVQSLTHSEMQGRIYELGGPGVYSFREILELILAATGRKNCLIPVPWLAASAIGFFGEWLPTPPLTRDQVRLLKQDNLVQAERDGFTALGISPTSLEIIMPQSLARYAVA